MINNIVIADMLRNIQRAQDVAYQPWERQGGHGQPRKALVIIEEAHEFLSADRISKMPILFEQVARIAKRGRKRWLALAFVTQLPQHLPREVLGLVNNHVLHKITDEAVIRSLRHVIPGIDEVAMAAACPRCPGPGRGVAHPHGPAAAGGDRSSTLPAADGRLTDADDKHSAGAPAQNWPPIPFEIRSAVRNLR